MSDLTMPPSSETGGCDACGCEVRGDRKHLCRYHEGYDDGRAEALRDANDRIARVREALTRPDAWQTRVENALDALKGAS